MHVFELVWMYINNSSDVYKLIITKFNNSLVKNKKNNIFLCYFTRLTEICFCTFARIVIRYNYERYNYMSLWNLIIWHTNI